MKRSPTNSSCSSSSSSSCLESDAVVPDHHHHDNHHQSVKPTKIKRPRKNQTKEKCQNANTSTTTTTTANLSGRRSSIYRGVTRHRWTGRFEAHLWDKSSWNNIQNKKGRQVYLGAYDCEEAAARTYDLAALKYWGPETTLNFPIETYQKELEEMQKVSKEEYLASLRRRSSGFSRGVSKYRGVARHHHNGRWEARIGRVFGNKYLYLGTYNTQEEAAAAYDMAAIEYRGANAVTNFDISHYIDQLKKKGIIPHQDQLPNSSTDQSEETEAEPEVEQPQPQPPQPPPKQPLEQPLLPPQQVLDNDQYSHITPSIDATSSTMVNVMDIPNEDDQDLTWTFCLDNAGLNHFPVPDFPLGNACDQLPNLFDDTGFEDNIDFMFDTMECCGVEVGVEEMNNSENEKERLLLLSSSSSSSASFSLSSSSTTTSISCNY